MNNVECESCVKRKTMYCPNSFKCYATKDKPYWQNRIMLLEENQQLHNKIDKVNDLLSHFSGGQLDGNTRELAIKVEEILKGGDVDE